MNTKHTPGPWVLDGVDIYPVGGHPLDPICAMSPGQGDAFQSNAQLIAAAPDLLAACQAARALWGDYLPPGNSKAMEAMRLVDEAISRATGGDQ